MAINMKKTLSIVLAVMMMLSVVSVLSVNAADQSTKSSGSDISFNIIDALYVHGVLNSDDSEAWQAWQSEHDEDFNEVNSNVKYFFCRHPRMITRLMCITDIQAP